MILDNKLINNRPIELSVIDFYTQLPNAPIRFAYDSLPGFLNIDMLQLIGIMPKTLDLIENTQRGFMEKPSQKEVEYYRKKGSRFQMVHIVANIHTFQMEGKEAVAYPYSISLIAGPKRGKPDTCSIDFLDKIGLDKFDFSENCYTDFSPFLPVQEGFYGPLSFFYGNRKLESYTDTIGFILETFFLPTDTDLREALIGGGGKLDPEISKRYNKYRIKRYFKPFTDIKPRRIWGCDSPIELFLVQSLAKNEYFPKIQTLIFKNGEIHDNFYDMISKNVFIKGDQLITDVDLYFPKEKVAVFCDGSKYHRGVKNKSKDERIISELLSLGIRSIRLSGKEIIKNLETSTSKVIELLKENT